MYLYNLNKCCIAAEKMSQLVKSWLHIKVRTGVGILSTHVNAVGHNRPLVILEVDRWKQGIPEQSGLLD